MGSGAVRTFEEFDASEEEDESEYPVGYFDDSEDDLEEEERDSSHLALPLLSGSGLEQDESVDTGLHSDPYGGFLDPSLEEEFLPQHDYDVDDDSIVEPHPEHAVDGFENDNFPEANYAEEEERGDDGYTPEEWAAWDAGAYDAHEYGGAQEEYVEHFDEYGDEAYYSDDY